MMTDQVFAYKAKFIHDLCQFQLMVQDAHQNTPPNERRIIQFNQCVFYFGNFNTMDLSHIQFNGCLFMEITSFGAVDLRTTRFTNSEFQYPLMIDQHFQYHPDSALFQADFSCPVFICSIGDLKIPLNATVSAEKIADGYNKNCPDPANFCARIAQNDEKQLTYAALKILADAIANTDQAAVKALKYAFYSAYFDRPVSIKISLIKECVSIGLRQFHNATIYPSDGSSLIDLSSLDLGRLDFVNVRFMQPVDLTSSNLVDANFNNAVFVAGLILDKNQWTGMVNTRFKGAICSCLYLAAPELKSVSMLPIAPYVFYDYFREHYLSLIGRSCKPINLLENEKPHLISDSGKAKRSVLEFLTLPDIWSHETGQAVSQHVVNQLLSYHDMLFSSALPNVPSFTNEGALAMRQLALLHTHLFNLSNVHQHLSHAIEQQQYQLVEAISDSKPISSSSRLLSSKLKSLQSAISTSRHEQNMQMMLKIALYYVKFFNPSAMIFSQFYSQMTFSESFLRTLYENALAFERSEISRLLPSQSRKRPFFSNSDDSLDDESDNDTSTQPPSPKSYQLGM